MSDMISPTELEKTKKDLAALKEQAAGLTREYDRLLEEHSKAQVGGEGRVYYKKTPAQRLLSGGLPSPPSLPSVLQIFNHFRTLCLNSSKWEFNFNWET